MLDGGARQWEILEMYSAIRPMSAVYTRNEAADMAQSRKTVPKPYLIQQEGSWYGTRSQHMAAVTRMYGYGTQPYRYGSFANFLRRGVLAYITEY